MALHKDQTGADLHEPKAISTAAVNQVYVADGLGGGTWRILTSNVVLINAEADLPAVTPVGGVNTHVLENKEYLINQDVTFLNPLGFPGAGNRATLTSVNRAVVTYTGTDACFRDTDAEGDIEIQGLSQYEAPNGDMWELTAVTGAFSFQASDVARFTNCNALGTIKGNAVSGFNLFFGTLSNFDQGLIVEDMNFFELNTMFFFGNNAAASTYITCQGTNWTGVINLWALTMLNGSNETAFNIKTEIQASVDTIHFTSNQITGVAAGTIFAPGSLDPNANKVFSVANVMMKDSRPDALTSFSGNATATVIATVDTPVLIAGTWVEVAASQFTTTVAGRATYTGTNPITVPVDALITGITLGGTDNVTIYLCKNSSIITASGTPDEFQNIDPTTIPLIWQVDMVTGDFLELFIENNTDISNLTVTDAKFRID